MLGTIVTLAASSDIDNGGTVGVNVCNAGMRGGKVTPYEGGTRVPSFWRWPAAFKGGVDCGALTAHIDIFPTLAEIAGAKLNSFKALYWKQFGGGPDAGLLKQMDPDLVNH